MMSDQPEMSLHEKLVAAFMASAETPAQIAAVNEILNLRARVAELEALLEKPAKPTAPKKPAAPKAKK